MPRFAAVQLESRPLDPERNLENVTNCLREAASSGAELVVFPECILTGYILTAEEAEEVAEPIPGPRTNALVAACRREGVLGVVGTIERDVHGQCYNSAVLLGPDGVIGTYRKTHLPCLGVDRYLAAGDELPGPFSTSLGRLGLLICYDLRFPEPCRVLALAGAQVILISTAWPDTATLYPQFMARSRAAENAVFLVAANRAGQERGARFLGHSLMVGPDGEVIAEAGGDEETILYADLAPSHSDQKLRVFRPGEYELDLFGDRRPDLYGPISGEREGIRGTG